MDPMCFSAKASFIATGLLVPLGAAAIEIAWAKGQRRMVPLAMVPLVFGVQQACEGVLWLGLEAQPLASIGEPPAGMVWASLAFLFFSYAFWPLWMPMAAVWLLPRSRLVQWPLVRALPLLGLLPGVLLWLPLLTHTSQALPHQSGRSLVYALPPWVAHLLPPFLGPALYAALIVIPLLLVPSARVRGFALTLLGAFALTEWSSSEALTSVWCYASALLSAQILWILQSENEFPATQVPQTVQPTKLQP